MSNIDKRPYRAGGGDIGTGRIREIADNPYGDEEKCWLAKRVLALLDELEAKDKSIGFLKDQLAQLANFNPDWDKLEAATYSLREHMAELTAACKRIAELEAKLETSDKLQDSAFRHGLQHGFSLGQTDNQAGFEECLSAYGTRGKDNG